MLSCHKTSQNRRPKADVPRQMSQDRCLKTYVPREIPRQISLNRCPKTDVPRHMPYKSSGARKLVQIVASQSKLSLDISRISTGSYTQLLLSMMFSSRNAGTY